jgi:hypothetical protein
MTTTKTLEAKLKRLRADRSADEFILCYAADPDIAAGIIPLSESFESRAAYLDHLEELIRQETLDILLTSNSTMDELLRNRRLFEASRMTPAVRANDATDNWHPRGGNYDQQLSNGFSSTTLDEAMYGTLTPASDASAEVDLGLYSITFNNDTPSDLRSLQTFREFRRDATTKGFRYFLEVFNPNCPIALDESAIPDFVNDNIARLLAGLSRGSRPEFIKMQYNGARAMQDLVAYTDAIVGILGGSPSTTYDAFKLLSEARANGARVALFGRRIKVAEHPPSFVTLLAAIAAGNIGPEEAVRAYRGELQKRGIAAQRSFEADMQLVTKEIR